MARPPAFQFYPADWADFKVARLSYEHQGMYIKLLCFMWRDSKDQCSVLADPASIASALGVGRRKANTFITAAQKHGVELFAEEERVGVALYVSERLRREAAAQAAHREERSESGKKGARARWQGHKLSHGSAINQPMANDGSALASASASKPSTANSTYSEGYLEDKLKRPLTADEKKSLKTMLRQFGDEKTTAALGSALEDGRARNFFALGTTIAQAWEKGAT